MTWQVGDLACAVGVNRADFPDGYFPEVTDVRGKVYCVASVNLINGIVGLRFDDFPSPVSHGHWHSASFRKIHPDKREACEPEFVTLLKRSKVTASGTLLEEPRLQARSAKPMVARCRRQTHNDYPTDP